MKVLFNCLTMEKGGAERVISTLANKIVENNSVTIISIINSESKYFLNSKVKHIKIDKKNVYTAGKIKRTLSKLSILRFSRLAKTIKEEKPDIIISFLPEPSMRLMLLKKFSKKIRQIPTIISIRNDPKIEYSNKLIHFAMKTLYKNVDGMVFQTEEAKEYFVKLFPDKKNLVVIHNPINEQFAKYEVYQGEREKTIVTVGRLEEQKKHKLLIEAFNIVHKKHKDYKLLIYGKGHLKGSLEELINSLNLQENVLLMGQVDNIQEQIYRAGIFVLSSDYEGMPNALMEAMALGLPCVSTDCPCGGPRELITDEKNGILVEVGNKTKMAEAINRIIENNQLSTEIGTNASKIKETHSIKIISNKWIEQIESLVIT